MPHASAIRASEVRTPWRRSGRRAKKATARSKTDSTHTKQANKSLARERASLLRLSSRWNPRAARQARENDVHIKKRPGYRSPLAPGKPQSAGYRGVLHPKASPVASSPEITIGHVGSGQRRRNQMATKARATGRAPM